MQIKRISVLEALRFSGTATLSHMRLFGVLLLLFAVVTILVVGAIALMNKGLLYALMDTPMFQSIQECVGRQCFTVVYQSSEPIIRLLMSNSISVIISALIIALFFSGIGLGLTKIALQVYDNNVSHAEILFSQFRLSLRAFAAWVIYCVMIWLGLICFIVPGIIILLRFSFFSFFIVDKNAGVIDSLTMSYNATRGHAWDLFALWFVIKLITYVFYFGGFVGAIINLILLPFMFTFPILAYAYVYRHLLDYGYGEFDSSDLIRPSA